MNRLTNALKCAWFKYQIRSVEISLQDNVDAMEAACDPFTRANLRHRREELCKQLCRLRADLRELEGQPGKVIIYGVA